MIDKRDTEKIPVTLGKKIERDTIYVVNARIHYTIKREKHTATAQTIYCDLERHLSISGILRVAGLISRGKIRYPIQKIEISHKLTLSKAVPR